MTPLAGTEVLPVVQSSATTKVSVANLTAGRSVSVADLAVSTGNITPSTAAKGINFTANTPASGMTSQLLNWYEEGTWTVNLYDAATGGNVSPTSWTGNYTRVGRQVTATFSSTNSIDTTGMTAGGTLNISLPFTAASGAVGSTIVRSISFVGYNYVVPYVPGATSTRAILRKVISAATDATILVSDLVSGTSRIFYFTVTYFV